MFNPNAPNRVRPSHSLNTPVPILIDSDEEISDAENENESENDSGSDSMQVDEYPQHQPREMNYSIPPSLPLLPFYLSFHLSIYLIYFNEVNSD